MKTIGSFFLEGQIQIVNHGRWRQVSMLERVRTKIPATFNAIESLKRHFNGVTPILYSFRGSLTRLADISLRRGETFHRGLIDIFQYEHRKGAKKDAVIATEQIDYELAFFETTDVTCFCGETGLAWDMYRFPVPCSHQFALLVHGNPDCRWNHCHGMSIEPLMPEFAVPEPPGIRERSISSLTSAFTLVPGTRMIPWLSKKGRLEQWIIANYHTGSTFALGETTAFWWMIKMAIEAFRAQA
jgi:hypothetical protein